jgi:hypothetical protein
MDKCLASFIGVFLKTNKNKDKKKLFLSLSEEIANLLVFLLEKNENIDGFFELFFNAMQKKNYCVQIFCCQMLDKYVMRGILFYFFFLIG